MKTIFRKKSGATKDIAAYFNIGMFVILTVFIVTLICFTLFDAVMIALLLFFVHLAIAAILCLGYAISYICFPCFY